MAGKIIIDTERCKGCGLCVTACPKGGITISKISNKNGYFPAQSQNTDCTGCCVCAIICPDYAIEVLCDENIIAVKSGSTGLAEVGKKGKPNLIKEKT